MSIQYFLTFVNIDYNSFEHANLLLQTTLDP